MTAAGTVRFATAAMGTRFELILGGYRPERWQAVGEEAVAVIEECHRRFSRFAADSLVSHVNRTAWQRPVRLDRDTFALFRDAIGIQCSSGGAFDVTVGRTMERLGFHPATGPWTGPDPQGRLPAPWADDGAGDPVGATAQATVEAPAIALDPASHTIRLRDAGVRIDLGAIAKGHALDLAGRVLVSCGVDCALLHGGTSSVLAIGAPPGAEGWGIALEGFAERVVLRDAALAVSAAAGGTGAGGTRHGHIIDPRNGRAVPLSRRVAVVGPTARACDAWATALAVLGARPPGLGPGFTTWFEPRDDGS